MKNDLIPKLIEYGEQLERGALITSPDIYLQIMLKAAKASDYLSVSKATLTYKELRGFKEDKDSIPNIIGNHKENPIDYALLAAIYTLKFLGGHYVRQIDLLIKLLSQPYNVENQMFKTHVNL